MDPATIRALSIAARASEVTDAKQREQAVGSASPTSSWPRQARATRAWALRRSTRAYPEIVTVLDYSKGFGHADVLTVSPGGIEMAPARDDDWGFGAALKPVS